MEKTGYWGRDTPDPLEAGWEARDRQPKVGLVAGLTRLVEWYQKEREWAKDISTGIK
jgi:hypothetical protein